MKLSYKNPLHPGQQIIWDALMKTKDEKHQYNKIVVNTGRQVGKTTLAKRWALNRAIKDPGCEIGWIVPESTHYNKVFQWFSHSLRSILKKVDGVKNILYFNNGSVIYFYSVENHVAIRGATFDYRILDEYGFGRFGQDEAVKSYGATMVAKGKQELILSTPKGKNHHYYAYYRAIEHPNQFAHKMKTEDNPAHDVEYLAEERRIKPKSMFEEEYEGKFLDNGGEVFKNLNEVSVIDKLPNYNKEQTVIGVDWGLVNDHTVVIVMNLDGDVVDTYISYDKHYPTIVDNIYKFIYKYNVVNGLAETNGVGLPNFQMLQDKIGRHIRPFTMTQQSKSDIVSNLNHAIQNKEVKLPTEECLPKMHFQLADYTFKHSANGKISYTHPPGGHDDWVDALTMCYQCVLDETNRLRTRTISRGRDRNNNRWTGVTRSEPGKYN